jgi:hypothetical protein
MHYSDYIDTHVIIALRPQLAVAFLSSGDRFTINVGATMRWKQ